MLLIHTLLLANQLDCDVLHQHLKETAQPSPMLIEATIFLMMMARIRIDLAQKLQIADVPEVALTP